MSDSSTHSFQLPLPNFGDERRKYTFYRIVNTLTGKCYVGITANPKERKKAHFKSLRGNYHHSKHLQDSFNKHGEKVFRWEVIEKQLCTYEDACEREKHWINHFDSYENGYNMTLEAGVVYTNCIPCVWEGVEYPSIAVAARQLGMEQAALYGRIVVYGYTCEADMVGSKPCSWNGVSYSSISEAAKANGIGITSMSRRLQAGYTCDEDMPGRGYSAVCEWNGVTYPSRKAMAEALGISQGLINYRLDKMGYTCDEDMKGVQKTPCEWNGISYSSVAECARANGVTDSAVFYWLKMGYKSDADLTSNTQAKGKPS